MSKPVVDELTEKMETPRTDAPPDTEEKRDLDGRAFDPLLHEYDEVDGFKVPRETSKGNLRKKRGQAKVKSRIGILEGKGVAPGDAPPGVMSAESAATGIATAELIFISCQAVGGPDWKPNDNERDYNHSAWGAYFEAKGIKDLPPGVVVLGAIAMYAGPRFNKPETRKRVGKAAAWFRTKFKRRAKTDVDADVKVDADAT